MKDASCGFRVRGTVDAAKVTKALSAGPADITKSASVMEMTPDGKMKQLRAGTNGWMCMPAPEVMCLDKQWQNWADAWMSKKIRRLKAWASHTCCAAIRAPATGSVCDGEDGDESVGSESSAHHGADA